MKTNILIWLLFPVFCFSQDRIFVGKIETETMLSNVLVVNLTQETETRTDGFGKFSMEAQVGDLLIFTGEFVQRTRFLVEEEHFGKENIIPLEFREIEIEAVAIERFNINPEDLGLVPRGQKQYTKAERRLFTAKTERGIGALINAISGRTKMLKLINEMDKEDRKVQYLSGLFEDEFFTETLNIDSLNIMEFKYFSVHFIEKELGKNLPKPDCGEEEKSYLRSLSKDQIEIVLISLAEKYLSLKNETLPNKD